MYNCLSNDPRQNWATCPPPPPPPPFFLINVNFAFYVVLIQTATCLLCLINNNKFTKRDVLCVCVCFLFFLFFFFGGGGGGILIVSFKISTSRVPRNVHHCQPLATILSISCHPHLEFSVAPCQFPIEPTHLPTYPPTPCSRMSCLDRLFCCLPNFTH